MTDELRELIVKRASNAEINRVAVASGMTTMLEDGLEKVVAGLTTLEEVLRIVKT
jgi:type II secretory ATPase GspE/PulE/Tfp pilus assembly ATPase PilB-like protein